MNVCKWLYRNVHNCYYGDGDVLCEKDNVKDELSHESWNLVKEGLKLLFCLCFYIIVAVDVGKTIHNRSIDDLQKYLNSFTESDISITTYNIGDVLAIPHKLDMEQSHDKSMYNNGNYSWIEVAWAPRVHEKDDEIHPNKDETEVGKENKSSSCRINIRTQCSFLHGSVI